MKNKIMKALLAVMVLTVTLNVPTYADNKKVTSVSISFNEDKSDPGVVYPVDIHSNSSSHEITSAETTSDYESWKPGRKVTYTIIVEPKDGYSFSKKDTKVSVSNGTIVSETIKSGSVSMKVNYIPKMTLKTPEKIYFEDEYLAVWDKVDHASMYEVKLYKDEKSFKTEKVKKNEIDLSNYATDNEDITFDVRAVAKDSDESKYLKSSEWVNCNETVSSSENTTYGSFNGNYDNYKFKNSDDSYATGWQFINGSWYYFDSFSKEKPNVAIKSSWLYINDHWYYFNDYCIMQTGWIQLNGSWYFLDGNGAMVTGWYCSGPAGAWYYLDPSSGAMWHDTTTPDGYIVDATGAYR